MDADRFDAVARSFSRRAGVRGLAAVALGVVGTQRAGAQTCTTNGLPCTDGEQCCSGRCKRKRGSRKKFCRAAPDQGTCTIEDDTCDGGSSACDAAGTSSCICHVTSGGFSFCGATSSGTCFTCTSDRGCARRPGVGQRGDRCVQCPSSCSETNHRMCVHKCSNPATP